MRNLACMAGLLVAASGAMAQVCETSKACTEEATTVQTVAQTEQSGCCESGKAQAIVQTAALAAQTDECCGESCDDAGACCDEKAATTTTASLRASIPAMMYVVGDTTTACSVEAEKLASSCEGGKKYKVGDSTFEDYMEASSAYSKELESYLDGLTRVSFVVDGECVPCPIAASEACEKTGKAMQYKVGPAVFDSAEEAVRAAAMAYGMSRQVKMSYAINGEASECAESFAKAKACTETKAAYRVADKETACEVEASCMLAMAKIEAALAAIEQSSNEG